MILHEREGRQPTEFLTSAMQNRIEMMLENADQLFSLGWLRKRLWKEFQEAVKNMPATEYGDYRKLLQGSMAGRFMMKYLSTYKYSFNSIKRAVDNAYNGIDVLKELEKEREDLIQEFACMQQSRTWEQVNKKDDSWLKFARRMPLDNDNLEHENNRFFQLLDRISIITDILRGDDEEYGLTIDYDGYTPTNYKKKKELTDELLFEAIEKCSVHIISKSSWAAVFGVLRDDYGYDNATQFERELSRMKFTKNLPDCPAGTISKTFSNNDYLKNEIEAWYEGKFSDLAAAFRKAIKEVLKQ